MLMPFMMLIQAQPAKATTAAQQAAAVACERNLCIAGQLRRLRGLCHLSYDRVRSYEALCYVYAQLTACGVLQQHQSCNRPVRVRPYGM
jgi:hypothetical protein